MMDEPKDAAEIIARIEAIDWQLSKPGAMALSRGWSRQEVATWAIRANDTRAHLVSHLVELRTQVRKEQRTLEDRILFLRREKEDALNSLAAAKAENAALRREIAALQCASSTMEADAHRVAAMEPVGEFECPDAARVISLTGKSLAMREKIANAPNQFAADNLRRVHRVIRREWQAAEEAFERWCSDRRREIACAARVADKGEVE